jgi:hypothetical protein
VSGGSSTTVGFQCASGSPTDGKKGVQFRSGGAASPVAASPLFCPARPVWRSTAHHPLALWHPPSALCGPRLAVALRLALRRSSGIALGRLAPRPPPLRCPRLAALLWSRLRRFAALVVRRCAALVLPPLVGPPSPLCSPRLAAFGRPAFAASQPSSCGPLWPRLRRFAALVFRPAGLPARRS